MTGDAEAMYRRLCSQEKHNIASRRSICELSDRYKAERDSLRGVVQAAEGRAIVEAEQHRPDDKRGGCMCGFCAWSVEHVVIMSLRAALAAAAERSPDAPQPADLGHDCSTRCDGADSELPGMWEHADFLGGADAPQSEPSTQEHDWGCREWGCDHPSPAVLPETPKVTAGCACGPACDNEGPHE